MSLMTPPGIGFVEESVLDLVGDTPVVDVSRLSPNPDVRILAKLEMQNPFGSVKDRIAKRMIEAAEEAGRLRPGQRIIEPGRLAIIERHLRHDKHPSII